MYLHGSVILSEVSVTRSEALMQSKDPYPLLDSQRCPRIVTRMLRKRENFPLESKKRS
jgi:hypothetical protein